MSETLATYRSDAIDPEFRRIATFLPRNIGRPWVVRASRPIERLAGRVRHRGGIGVVEVGSVSMRLHRPSEPGASSVPLPGLLWMHGGGFVLGAAAQDDRLCRKLADELGAVVAAVDYRLAPEHPFPTPLADCHDALVGLAGLPEVDAGRIVIAGRSAGGGLTAQLAILARERDEVRPIYQALVYPMLDDRTVLRSDVDESRFRVWNNAANRYGWSSYLGGDPGGADTPALAAPARCDDLGGLPPAWIGVGTLDLFHDEDAAYARRLRSAGVACELVVIDGVFHGFDAVVPGASATRRFRSSMIEAIRAALVSSG